MSQNTKNGDWDEFAEWYSYKAPDESEVNMIDMAYCAWTAGRQRPSSPSEVQCARCGGACVEFTVPNDIWNAVIRRGGPERDDEYLCLACWYSALREHIAQLAAPSAFKYRKPGSSGYDWRFSDWTESSSKEIAVLLSRGCEVVKLYAEAEKEQ